MKTNINRRNITVKHLDQAANACNQAANYLRALAGTLDDELGVSPEDAAARYQAIADSLEKDLTVPPEVDVAFHGWEDRGVVTVICDGTKLTLQLPTVKAAEAVYEALSRELSTPTNEWRRIAHAYGLTN